MTGGLGLGDAYGATLDRIKGQGGEKARLGMAASMWISHSEQPLKADELCHALSVEIGSPHLNSDDVPSIGTLLSCCQGLITVDEASTVRLIHLTLQEYLRAHPELFGTAHSTIAETCLSYLNSEQVKPLLTSPSIRFVFCPLATPFLQYSALYWGVHAKRDLSDRAKSLALKLLVGYSNHISAEILLKTRNPYLHKTNFNKLSLFSGLHCASVFGIVEVVASLLEVEGCDINQIDCAGNTPLVWAAKYGHEEVVKVLLGRNDVKPDKPDVYGRTPLYHAAGCGKEGVVKLLFARDDVNPDKPDLYGRTPLYHAAWSGQDRVVKLLLGRDDVNPDKPDVYGRTPLYHAAGCGKEGVVKLLLERDDVSPDKLDVYGLTPLYHAAWGGRDQVVKLLLGRDDVSPNKSDKDGQTPLHCAARYGHRGVVKLLLRRDDVSPGKPDNGGRTPLWWAARNDYPGVVELLQSLASTAPSTA